MKKKAWCKITAKINAVGDGNARTVEQVKKKWQDVQGVAKRHYSDIRKEHNKTGNKPIDDGKLPSSLGEFDAKIRSIIDIHMVEGVDGGVDTEPLKSKHPSQKLLRCL